MQESQIERRLAQGVKAKGGMCMKFTSPGLPGVPDRIVLLPDGRVIFIAKNKIRPACSCAEVGNQRNAGARRRCTRAARPGSGKKLFRGGDAK